MSEPPVGVVGGMFEGQGGFGDGAGASLVLTQGAAGGGRALLMSCSFPRDVIPCALPKPAAHPPQEVSQPDHFGVKCCVWRNIKRAV